MFYFTYKLKTVSKSGISPKGDGKENSRVTLGIAPLPDGSMLGSSTVAINSIFNAQELSDFNIVEIAQAAALTRCKQVGMNDPQVDANGAIFENDSPYLEKRGAKFIQGCVDKANGTKSASTSPDPAATDTPIV